MILPLIQNIIVQYGKRSTLKFYSLFDTFLLSNRSIYRLNDLYGQILLFKDDHGERKYK